MRGESSSDGQAEKKRSVFKAIVYRPTLIILLLSTYTHQKETDRQTLHSSVENKKVQVFIRNFFKSGKH